LKNKKYVIASDPFAALRAGSGSEAISFFSLENRDNFARPGKTTGRAGVASLLVMTNPDFFNNQ
jgi:hypothetical protein